MRRILLLVLIPIIGLYMSGCGKKKQALEEMQEPISMEMLSNVNVQKAASGEAMPQQPVKPQIALAPEGAAPKLESLPPQGPYKPTVEEIQKALKNSGFYTGKIDGKSGPMTKKAIEEFQKAKGLVVDGKVGPKTWGALKGYLEPPKQAQKK